MKILHIGKFYPPENGGIETVTLNCAESEAKNGHSITVLAFTNSKASTLNQNGVEVIRCKINMTIASQPISISYLFRLSRLILRNDILHFHFPNLLPLIVLLLSVHRSKLLLHWHADILKNRFINRLVAPLIKLLTRRADVIITTSKIYSDATTYLKRHSGKTWVIPLGIVDRASPVLRGSGTKKQECSKKKILTVGRLVPYKGLETLLDAMEVLPGEYTLSIVGKGELYTSLQENIRSKGLENRVTLLGSLCDTELQKQYESCDVFCLPSISRAEAFGVVLLEAMSFAKPLVTSDVPGSGMSWVNKDGQTGFHFASENAHDLAMKIAEIFKEEKQYLQLCNNSRNRFLQKFELSVVEKLLSEQYKRLSME